MRQGKRRAAAAVVLALVGPAALAAEVGYDFVACTHSRRTPLMEGGDVVAFGFELWGVVASSTTKQWEQASTHCLGTLRVAGGPPIGQGLCKWVDAQGDTAIGEFRFAQGAEPAWTWLSGTGKLKGITGSGTFRELFDAKPVEPGTSQGCRRDWGKYTLP